MFCCRGSSCLGEDDCVRGKKGSKLENQKLFAQQNGHFSSKSHGKLQNDKLNFVPAPRPAAMRSDVKHVTNVQKDVYLKLSNTIRRQESPGSFLNERYGVVIVPKTIKIENLKFAQPRQVASNSKHVVVKTEAVKATHEIATGRTENQLPPPARESMRLSTEFSVCADDNRTSTPFPFEMQEDGGISVSDDSAIAIFDTADTQSLTEEQRVVIEQLEASLTDFEEGIDDTPIIVAEVLPHGVFTESDDIKTDDNMTSSPADSSEDEPSSVNSRTGIISKKRQSLNIKKNRNSVSFQLPDGHVDKPYSPLQTSGKSKSKAVLLTLSPPEQQEKPQPPTLRVTGNDVAIWHTGNNVYVENNFQRRMSGPFKGSFKSLFYTKYNKSDLKTYEEHRQYLAPKIMEKVSSFENIKSHNALNNFRPNTAIVRRNTYR